MEISKVTLPNGSTYDIKDSKARDMIFCKTEAEWALEDPVLPAGAIGFVADGSSDHNMFYKIGDGVSSWSGLEFAAFMTPDILADPDNDISRIYASGRVNAGSFRTDNSTGTSYSLIRPEGIDTQGYINALGNLDIGGIARFGGDVYYKANDLTTVKLSNKFDSIDAQLVTQSSTSGGIVVIADAAAVNAEDVEMDIDYVQGGHTGCKVLRRGKNFWEFATLTTTSARNALTRTAIDIKPGAYVFSCKKPGAATYGSISFYDAAGDVVTSMTLYQGEASKAVTLDRYVKSVTVYFAGALSWAECQLELGTAATDYEEYKASEVSVSWESTVGIVYGGMLNVTTGRLTSTLDENGNELTSPMTYQITPQQIKMLQGTNALWADTGNIEVYYQPDNVIGELKALIEAQQTEINELRAMVVENI